MLDLTLCYRECGAECREDWLRMLACDNGLPLAEVQRAADRLGEREDFARLVDWCEAYRGHGCSQRLLAWRLAQTGDDRRVKPLL